LSPLSVTKSREALTLSHRTRRGGLRGYARTLRPGTLGLAFPALASATPSPGQPVKPEHVSRHVGNNRIEERAGGMYYVYYATEDAR
jgi:hypothetical protein